VTGREHPLWDLTVRITHWLIALLLPVAWWTAEEGDLDRHQWVGITILLLVLTRLAWGFLGSPQARFGDFLRGPGKTLEYLRGAPASTPGHNPLGGWSVMALWALLLVQGGTGLFNADDVLFTGPFHYVFDSDVTDQLAAVHDVLFNVIVAFVVLHVAAVIYYERVRDQRLLWPMVKGSADGRYGTGPTRSIFIAVAVAAVLGGILWYLMEIAPSPPASYW
jgi:cytochrome b